MASLVPGFEYDIFISYRHNDNRSGWVAEFVKALQEELASTIKEPVSVYFDTNLHDGLLETHNVDKSLEGKLKCLIFIPIISQTYCDPKSFAWQHEFCAFNKLSKEDQLGRDIKLSNGNVASRILPVKIHELDADDKATIENEIGGVLRAIEFIYKESGVNRPLKTTDNKSENQNKTDYRNQINKLANSTKELIYTLRNSHESKESPQVIQNDKSYVPLVNKSIVVLPFVNMSNDSDQEYFSDGLTEEIITDLSRLNDLLVISRSSAMTFKSSSKKIKEIADELNVQYVLEGSVRKSGNNLRITAQLIDAGSDAHLWAEKYNGSLEDVFDIQEKVSRAIVGELKIHLSEKEDKGFSERPINNIAAHDCYLRARRELVQWNEEATDRALKYLENALSIIGPNPQLFAGLAYTYWSYANFGRGPDEYMRKTEEFVQKTFDLDPESPEAHLVLATIEIGFKGRPLNGIRHLKETLKLRPNDFDANMWLAVVYIVMGHPEKAIPFSMRMQQGDPLNAVVQAWPGLLDFYSGNFNKAIGPYQIANEMEPENFFYTLSISLILCIEKNWIKASDFISSKIKDSDNHSNTFYKIMLFAIKKDAEKVNELLSPEFKKWCSRDLQWSHFLAQVFAVVEMRVETFIWIENAVERGFCNYPLLSTKDPIKSFLNSEVRFQKLLERMKVMWEKFD